MSEPDPNGPYEGRTNMREITEREWREYTERYPLGEWSIDMTHTPNRYFIRAVLPQLVGVDFKRT